MSDIRGVFNRVPTHRVPEHDRLPEEQRPFMLLFRCPGCGLRHGPTVGSIIGGGPRWTWNGSYDKAVFGPSILVTWPEYTKEAQDRDRAYYAIHGDYGPRPHKPEDWKTYVCHSYVGCNGAQPGEIIFLNDCTHHLAGKSVPIPPYRVYDK